MASGTQPGEQRQYTGAQKAVRVLKPGEDLVVIIPSGVADVRYKLRMMSMNQDGSWNVEQLSAETV